MNQPIYSEQYGNPHPMSIGELRMGGTPPVVVRQSRVSTPLLIAGGVAVLIGVSALASYLYQEKKEHDRLALSPEISQPVAQPSSTPPTAPTAQDSPSTQPLDPLSKEKEQNAMPMAGQANNHSSESLEPAKTRESATKASRSTAPSKAPATKPAPSPAPQPTIAPEPVKEPEVLKSEPPPAPPKEDDKSGSTTTP